MNASGRNHRWSSLGKRFIISSLALLVPAVFAILYFAYSFSLGSSLQNILIYSIIGLEVAMFSAGIILLVMGRFLKP